MLKKVSPKVDFIRIEHEMLDFWESEQIFSKLREQLKDKPRWSFIDGPITANNPMGVHHAWGRTYKDIFHRFKAMTGHNMRFQNGFDCQGLWVEVEVEKELGLKSKNDIEAYGIENFVKKCKERVHKYSQIQTKQSIRLGYWMDWDNSYFTMSDENNYTIWHFLKKCHEKGWIYKGHDVMPWCTRCGASLSEHEIATEGYKELTHTSIYVRFPLSDKENEYLLVWTTTPWTLTSNTAAAVHPDLTYVKVKNGDALLYLVEDRLNILQGDYEVIGKLSGKEMLEWRYEGPFDELPAQRGVEHRVIPWDEVSASDGSGIVHIAPGCGKEDFELGRQFNLSVIAPLDQFGNYLEGFDWLTGKNVDEVGEPIIRNLKEKNLLYHKEPITHRYPTCWRHGTELVFRLVDEWFIRMDEIRQAMMDVTRQIRWIPEYGMDHELDWLRNMDDWMISKKRYWGLALPIFECSSCGHYTVIGSREELQRKAVEGWEKFDGHSPHRPWIDNVKIRCEKCGEKVSRINDVGNPWLDAGIVPYSTLHYLKNREYWKKWFPAEFVTESLPGQFRNWFYSLIAMSTVLENKPPFLTILGHALVRDENGNEMHKSLGNAIWFDDAAEKMGVDVMRWLYANHNPMYNLNFGYRIGQEIRKKLITLWNVYSFFTTYAVLDKFSPQKNSVPYSELPELDRWILSELHDLFRFAKASLNDYNVEKVMKRVEKFLDDLSNWYVRRSRRRFWKSENDRDKWAAYHTLYQALTGLLKVLAPVVPFITDYIYQNLVRALNPNAPESIHLCTYPEANSEFIDDELNREMSTLIKIIEIGRSARNKANIKIRQPLKRVLIHARDSFVKKIADKFASQIIEELNVKEVQYIDTAEKIAVLSVKPNFAVIGKVYGKLIPQIQKALSLKDPSEIAETIHSGNGVELQIDGQRIELGKEELILELKGRDKIVVQQDGPYLVGIDTDITEKLAQEGLIRDLVRHIQTMRKDANFNVEDRIAIHLEAEENVLKSVENFADYLKNETLCTRLITVFDKGEYHKEIKLGKESVKIGILRTS